MGPNTRKRVHNFVAPLRDDSNFIPRMLYSFENTCKEQSYEQ